MSTKLTGYVWDGCAASGMKLSSVAIMARLADFSNDEGVCWPSIETIARQIGAGMSTVRTAIARLEAEGWLTRKARRQGISGSVNANSGTLNNVTINQNCTIKGMLEATQVRGDFVKAVSKAFPKKVGTWGNTETPNGTVTVTISDDHNFDRQIIIPPIIFNGIAYSDPGSGNNPGGTRYTGYGFEVRKNGVLIASRETKGAIPGSYSAVIDMPSGRGSVTLEFKIFQKGNQGAGNITDCTVIVTKKAASGISIR